MKKIKLLTAMSTLAIASSAFATIELGTRFQDHYGSVNVRMAIQCNSEVVVHNDDNNTRKYWIVTKVCAQNKDCYENKGQITIEAGKTFRNAYQTLLWTTFNRPGKKDIDCMNYVSGDEGRTEIKRAFAYIS